MKSKHPAQAEANPEAFLECDKLPSLLHVDITASHVEKIAKVLSGSAGISGLDSQQWHSMLLKFGKVSEHLRESIAALTRRLANTNVPPVHQRTFEQSKQNGLSLSIKIQESGLLALGMF